MKQKFVEFLNALMAAAPEVVDEQMTDEIKAYIEAITMMDVATKPEVTDNGKLILNVMQKSQLFAARAKAIADELGVSSRSISGALRKLVADGFCEKVGANPTLYSLTEKGKNYKID